MSRRAQLPLAFGLTAVLACSAGCSSGPAIKTVADLDVVIAGRTSGGMDARLGGTVARVGEDCLGVMAGDQAVVIAWPPGTDVTSTDGNVTLEVNGRRFEVGDTISGTGGELQPNSEHLPELPEGCAGLSVFALQSVDGA